MLFKIIKYLFLTYLTVSLFIYIFFIPPFEKPDENLHFLRTVSVSQGNFICKTDANNKIINKIPVSIYEYEQKNSKKINTNTGKPSFVDQQITEGSDTINEVHSCVLPFFYYLVTGFNMSILRFWNFSPQIIFYSGRLINTLITLLIVYLSLRNLPLVYQTITLYILSWPMVLYQISSYSKDAYFIALGIYVFNRFMSFMYHKKLNNLALITFITALILFILTRPPYLFFGLLLPVVLSIRKNKNFNFYNKTLFFGTILVVMLLLCFLLANKVYITPYNTNHSLPYYGQIDPQLQFMEALTHPIDYLLTLLRTILTFWVFYLKSSIGIFGYLSQSLPNYVYILFLFIGVPVVYIIRKEPKISRFAHLKNPLILITVLTVVVLFSVMYLYGSPVGAPLINGIQGRYLIILIPLLILLAGII